MTKKLNSTTSIIIAASAKAIDHNVANIQDQIKKASSTIGTNQACELLSMTTIIKDYVGEILKAQYASFDDCLESFSKIEVVYMAMGRHYRKQHQSGSERFLKDNTNEWLSAYIDNGETLPSAYLYLIELACDMEVANE